MGHFRDESFQAIDYTGTDNQKHGFRFRFICIVAWRLKITENEKKQFTTNKAKKQ